MAIIILSCLLLGSLYINSADAATIVVGGDAGWIRQSYTEWSANNPVTVGDILVFNYIQGAHDLQIFASPEAYTSCNFTGATLISYGSNYTVNSTTPVYFGCSFPNHCAGGQKLNVTALAATAPAPTPAPTPAAVSNYSAVICWSTMFGTGCVPQNYSEADYAKKVFAPGSVVAFNFTKFRHDLWVLPDKAAFDACNFSAGTVIVSLDNTTNTGVALYTVNLTAPVTYFSCGVSGHCARGQKLALNTSATATPSPPRSTPAAAPPTAAKPPPPKGSSAMRKFVPQARIMSGFAVVLAFLLL